MGKSSAKNTAQNSYIGLNIVLIWVKYTISSYCKLEISLSFQDSPKRILTQIGILKIRESEILTILAFQK